MTSPDLPAQPEPRPAPEASSVPWTVVAGLSTMALLWPLTGLTGIVGTGAPRAFAVIGVTAVVWIGVVGLGRVPRPVLTLTLTGLAYGLVAAAVGQLLPALGGFDGAGAPAWTVVPALLFDALWGALAGLAAAGVQRMLGADR